MIDSKKEDRIRQDKIRGSLFGGAVGDALGYPVEFMSENEIERIFGTEGITEYKLTDGKALISDDTQMTLFTANGILVGETRLCMRGIGGIPHIYVPYAYHDWLKTQSIDMNTVNSHDRYTREGGDSWLLDVPELYSNRAPGNTCLSAIKIRSGERYPDDFIHSRINNSKGCGGVMRIAPLALRYGSLEKFYNNLEELDEEAAQLAAITHSHSLGYMPAAVLNHIISEILFSPSKIDLKKVVLEAKEAVVHIFAGDEHLSELTDIIDLAVALSENEKSDRDNIHVLGEGWVAEETLAIAIYCSLKYKNDFSKGIIAAVNHGGDSDSTGAVTGNILGALSGYEAIDEKWKKDLELSDIILEMADDLYNGCKMSEYGSYRDPVWISKYIRMHRKTSEAEE